MDLLHRKGLCHGDFRPQNILRKLKPGCIEHIKPDDMWYFLGSPEMAEARMGTGQNIPHAPNEMAKLAPWQRFQWFVVDEIAIVDFGESYIQQSHKEYPGVPLVYANREVPIRNGQPGF